MSLCPGVDTGNGGGVVRSYPNDTARERTTAAATTLVGPSWNGRPSPSIDTQVLEGSMDDAVTAYTRRATTTTTIQMVRAPNLATTPGCRLFWTIDHPSGRASFHQHLEPQ